MTALLRLVVRLSGWLLAGTIATYFAVTVLPFRPTNPFASSAFERTRTGAIAIWGPSLFASRQGPAPLEEDAFRDGRFTVALDVVAAEEGLGPSRILAHTRDAGAHNWMIGQEGDTLVVRHRGREATLPKALRPGRPARWTIELEGDRVSFVGRDGARRTHPLEGPPRPWVGLCWLTLANESTGDRPWTGVVRSLELRPAGGPTLRLAADSTELVLAADGGPEVRLRRIPWPWIRKLRSALRSFPPDDAGDVAANVTMTVPLGFFFVLWRRRARPGRALIALLVLQTVVTVVAETVQMVSLYRQPDVTDLVSNLAGALIGTGLARAVLQQTE